MIEKKKDVPFKIQQKTVREKDGQFLDAAK